MSICPWGIPVLHIKGFLHVTISYTTEPNTNSILRETSFGGLKRLGNRKQGAPSDRSRSLEAQEKNSSKSPAKS